MTSSAGPKFTAMRDDRIGTVAVTISVWAWCALLSFPMIAADQDLTELAHAYTSSGAVLIAQIAGLALFLIAICLSRLARAPHPLGRLRFAQIAILTIFFLSLALQLHDEESRTMIGILYTCIFLATALALSVLWTMAPDDLTTCMTGAAVILCSFGIAAIAVLGMPQGRSIGNIQPNLFATPLLAGFIFSQFRPGLIGVAVRILCFAMVALVSSRFAVLGCIAAFVLHELTLKPLSLGKLPLLVVALIAGVAFWPQITAILALDDPTRDLSSGFSGRDAYWEGSLAAITEHPFGIGFKRTIGDESGHNGYLKILLEFGIIGGCLIIFCVGCILVMAGIDAIGRSGKDRQQQRFACARFGGLVALAFGALFQPQLFNLGDAFGISLLFLLFRPRIRRKTSLAPVRSGRFVSPLEGRHSRGTSAAPAPTPTAK